MELAWEYPCQRWVHGVVWRVGVVSGLVVEVEHDELLDKGKTNWRICVAWLLCTASIVVPEMACSSVQQCALPITLLCGKTPIQILQYRIEGEISFHGAFSEYTSHLTSLRMISS